MKLYKIMIIMIIIIIIITLTVVVIGCVTSYKYELSEIFESKPKTGEISYSLLSLEHEQRMILDTSHYNKIISDTINNYRMNLAKSLKHISPYMTDNSKSYFQLEVDYTHLSENLPVLLLRADSVYVSLSDDRSYLFQGAEQVNKIDTFYNHVRDETSYSNYFSVVPIPAPKGYKGDFKINIILKIMNKETSEIIDELPVELFFERKVNSYWIQGW